MDAIPRATPPCTLLRTRLLFSGDWACVLTAAGQLRVSQPANGVPWTMRGTPEPLIHLSAMSQVHWANFTYLQYLLALGLSGAVYVFSVDSVAIRQVHLWTPCRPVRDIQRARAGHAAILMYDDGSVAFLDGTGDTIPPTITDEDTDDDDGPLSLLNPAIRETALTCVPEPVSALAYGRNCYVIVVAGRSGQLYDVTLNYSDGVPGAFECTVMREPDGDTPVRVAPTVRALYYTMGDGLRVLTQGTGWRHVIAGLWSRKRVAGPTAPDTPAFFATDVWITPDYTVRMGPTELALYRTSAGLEMNNAAWFRCVMTGLPTVPVIDVACAPSYGYGEGDQEGDQEGDESKTLLLRTTDQVLLVRIKTGRAYDYAQVEVVPE